MNEERPFQFLLLLGTLLCATAIFLFFHSEKLNASNLIAQYTYKGPITPVPGNPQLVRIEVLVKDSPEAGGVQIQSAQFNGEAIPLKPRDIYGNRGSASFQLAPGKYKLSWVTQRDKFTWPRTMQHDETVTVSPRDLWLQISIVGDESSIR